MELIDKDALVEEIERLYNRAERRVTLEKEGLKAEDTRKYEDGLADAYDIILSFIDTLEVKEVDLEKEIDSYFERFQNVQCDEDCCNEGGFCCVLDNDLKIVDIERCRKIARHFFELGLKAQKGE